MRRTFDELSLKRARARSKLWVPVTVQPPGQPAFGAQGRLWRDSEEVPTDIDTTIIESVWRFTFLLEQVGLLPKDTLVTHNDGRVFKLDGVPVRERDHEVRYDAELRDAG